MIEPQGAMVDQLERWLKKQEDPLTYRSKIVVRQGTQIKQ